MAARKPLAQWTHTVPGGTSPTRSSSWSRGRCTAPSRWPSFPEFIELIADTGAGLYACQASVDLFGLTKDDFIDQVEAIITVGEFYEIAAGGHIIFT